MVVVVIYASMKLMLSKTGGGGFETPPRFFGNPAIRNLFRTRGFASPGYPGFAFSKTGRLAIY